VDEPTPLIGAVHLARALPLAWRPLPAATPRAVENWMHTNAVLLRALATLETQPPASDYENETGNALGRVLERLEAKTDLALSLLGRLLDANGAAAEPRPVRLGALGIEWPAGGDIAPGTPLLVSLHLSPRLPYPLELPVSVQHCANGNVQAAFTHLDDETRDWLERTVFRYHRRAIQASRTEG
jgi:hypothetical protein